MASSNPPPTNYKANVNRNKTKKWAEARQQNYDGDDWGGDDLYDEYAAMPEPSHSTPSSQVQSGPRRNSFEAGEERRAFSAGGNHHSQSQSQSHSHSQTNTHDNTTLRRDFSQPAQMPPPLRMSPETSHPPMRTDTDTGTASAPSPTPPPVHLVRPADIYKRMEEERQKERASLDSARSGSDRQPSPQPPRPADLQPVTEVSTPVLSQSSDVEHPSQPTAIHDDSSQTKTDQMTEVQSSRPAAPTAGPTSPPALSHPRQNSSTDRQSAIDPVKPESPLRQQPLSTAAPPHARVASPGPIPLPASGRHSPAPGRVMHLAGRYNDIGSREGSPTSPSSKTSVASWERSDTSRRSQLIESASPHLGVTTEAASSGSGIRPDLSSQSSFRPQIPGQWVSYTTNPPPNTKPDQPALDESTPPASDAAATSDHSTPQPARPNTDSNDQTPRARQADGVSTVDTVRAAGDALGSAFLSAAGIGSQESRSQPEPTKDNPVRAVGDVALRPLTMDRAASSVRSSGPPSPPQKDTPLNDSLPAHGLTRPDTNDSTVEESENDRLRRDIVKSLDPIGNTAGDDSLEARDVTAADPAPIVSLNDRPAEPLSNVAAAGGFLDQRFSWEENTALFNSSEPLPDVSEQSNVDTPGTQTLVSADSVPERTIPNPDERSPVSPISAGDAANDVDDNERLAAVEAPESVESERGAFQPPATGLRKQSTTDRPPSAQLKIPSYRELMTIKAPPERLAAINKARDDTARMDTGLHDWLAAMLDANPDFARHTPIVRTHTVTEASKGPSIARLAKGLTHSHSNASEDSRPTAATQKDGGGATDTSHGLLKSKELLGKGVVGAKGWLAKGKQKLRESSSAKAD